MLLLLLTKTIYKTAIPFNMKGLQHSTMLKDLLTLEDLLTFCLWTLTLLLHCGLITWREVHSFLSKEWPLETQYASIYLSWLNFGLLPARHVEILHVIIISCHNPFNILSKATCIAFEVNIFINENDVCTIQSRDTLKCTVRSPKAIIQ